MFQKMFNYLNIDNSWLGRLIAMVMVATCYSVPYFAMVSIGLKPAYQFGDFIFTNNYISVMVLVTLLVIIVYSANYLTKPQNKSEWQILIKNNPTPDKAFTLNKIIIGLSEEIIFRYICFFNITTLLAVIHTPEIISVLTFVAISSHLFSKTHRKSSNKVFYDYYLVAGILLGLTFLLTGLVGSVIIHLAFNLTTDLTKNYHITHPIN